MTQPITSTHRGHPIHYVVDPAHEDGGVWRYDSDGVPVPDDPERPCGLCRAPNRADGHDPCLGELPGVMNACCGHGGSNPYIQMFDGHIVDGARALDLMARMKGICP